VVHRFRRKPWLRGDLTFLGFLLRYL